MQHTEQVDMIRHTIDSIRCTHASTIFLKKVKVIVLVLTMTAELATIFNYRGFLIDVQLISATLK